MVNSVGRTAWALVFSDRGSSGQVIKLLSSFRVVAIRAGLSADRSFRQKSAAATIVAHQRPRWRGCGPGQPGRVGRVPPPGRLSSTQNTTPFATVSGWYPVCPARIHQCVRLYPDTHFPQPLPQQQIAVDRPYSSEASSPGRGGRAGVTAVAASGRHRRRAVGWCTLQHRVTVRHAAMMALTSLIINISRGGPNTESEYPPSTLISSPV